MKSPFKAISGTLALSLFLMGCPAPNQSGTTKTPETTTSSAARADGLSQSQGKRRNAGQGFDPGNPDTSAKGGKTLFAVYLLGSDLEDDVSPRDGQSDESNGKQSTEGAGSNDLREMAAAFKTMSNAERANLDVVVGFGGARKAGWKGIKYTDANCIIKDAADNYFGNDSCYSQQTDSANMGKSQTLGQFVNHLKNTYPSSNYGKRIMVLWDHGGAHTGYGPDTNFPEDGVMSIEDINQALAADPKKYDMIGFDACLMGNLDVARQVKDHAHFMLASEELEPGHGWQYTDVLGFIAKTPNASTVDIGKHMVNSFVTHSDHVFAAGKTLSLVNLDKFNALEGAINQLSSELKGSLVSRYKTVLEAASKAEKYGKSAKAGSAYAMDMMHFLKRLKTSGIQTDAVEQALNSYTMYSRQDGSRPQAKGSAIYSIINKTHFKGQNYNAKRAVSQGWYDFVSAFLNQGLNDTQAPTVQQAPANTPVTLEVNQEENPLIDSFGEVGEFENFEEGEFEPDPINGEETDPSLGGFPDDGLGDGGGEFDDGSFGLAQTHSETKEGDAEGDSGISCKDGHCFKVDDNLGVEEVLAVRVKKTGESSYQLLTQLPALEVAEGTYRTPKWDGKVFHLCASQACDPGRSLMVPLTFDEYTDDDSLVYFTDGQVNGLEATFYIEMDQDREVLDVWAVPYEADEEGNVKVITRDQIDLNPGDKIAFYIESFDTQKDIDDDFKLTEAFEIGEEPAFSFKKPEGELFTFIFAEDLKGNIENSPLQKIK